jgi:hypothetical protein
MRPAWTIAIVAAMGGVALASPPEPVAPVARYAPKGYPSKRGPSVQQLDGIEYLYVAVSEGNSSHTAGAGAMMLQADPALGATDFHSLAEIAVESGDGLQIVELGWTVDRGVNGDVQPHVFAYHWVNGQVTCYNGCGWVQVSATKMPGMQVVAGESHLYEIKLVNGDWWEFFDGEAMGYFPQALWDRGFTQATLAQWFGEVAASSKLPCTQMGNGKPGMDPASASFDELHRFDPGGAMAQAAGNPGTISNPGLYSIGRATATSFGFGGPGTTTAGGSCCMPSTCEAQQAECGSFSDPACPGNTLSCGTCVGCTADHKCPERTGGGCCDAGGSGAGALALGPLVALWLRRRRGQARD